MKQYTLKRYEFSDGTQIFERWFQSVSDIKAKAAMLRRFARLEQGLMGDCKALGGGVWELRVDVGPGYRVYYSIAGKEIILLLLGGDKRTQARDIEKAKEYWQDYKTRK